MIRGCKISLGGGGLIRVTTELTTAADKKYMNKHEQSLD